MATSTSKIDYFVLRPYKKREELVSTAQGHVDDNCIVENKRQLQHCLFHQTVPHCVLIIYKSRGYPQGR